VQTESIPHSIAAPAEGRRPRAEGRDWLLLLAFAAVAAALVRAVWFTPIELRQGAAQKIFYVHVPSAFITLYVAFPILAICSAAYLWLRDERLDRAAESTAEVGLVYMTVVLVTGPIWARPIWGAWWTWDMRLTLTLFLWFVVLGYLLLRGAVDEPGARARFSAVLAVLALLLVPFIHLSVYLFRTLHPQPVLLKPSRPSLPGEMLTTFLAAFLAFTLLFGALVRARYRYAVLRDAAAAERARLGAEG
jgi:heme exporter protein C